VVVQRRESRADEPALHDVMPGSIPRVYLVAGTLEPFFLGNANRWAAALRDAGADVVMSERVASHGAALWQGEFPLMVAWAFGRGPALPGAALS
jgi:hypothetical protein